MSSFYKSILTIFFISIILCEERKDLQSPYHDQFKYSLSGKIGDNPSQQIQ